MKMSKWKPDRGDMYYFPRVYNNGTRVGIATWADKPMDLMHYKNGRICRTKAETIRLGERIRSHGIKKEDAVSNWWGR